MNAFCRCFLNTICTNDITNWNSTAVYGVWVWSVLWHRQLIDIQASLPTVSRYVDLISACFNVILLYTLCCLVNVLFMVCCIVLKVLIWLLEFYC